MIVNFFAAWCQPCKRETPLLARYYRDSGGRGSPRAAPAPAASLSEDRRLTS